MLPMIRLKQSILNWRSLLVAMVRQNLCATGTCITGVRRMSEDTLNINDAELRRYFPLPKVLEGMFSLCEDIFALKIEPCQAQVWHKDVHFYRVYDSNNTHLASFYFDPYSRSGMKSSGAWMSYYTSRNPNTKPVTQVTCNFSSPVGEQPSLLDFGDVVTLFHEFGHTLHHMLTRADYNYNAGVGGVEWDVIELPSQFMGKLLLSTRSAKKHQLPY